MKLVDNGVDYNLRKMFGIFAELSFELFSQF